MAEELSAKQHIQKLITDVDNLENLDRNEGIEKYHEIKTNYEEQGPSFCYNDRDFLGECNELYTKLNTFREKNYLLNTIYKIEPPTVSAPSTSTPSSGLFKYVTNMKWNQPSSFLSDPGTPSFNKDSWRLVNGKLQFKSGDKYVEFDQADFDNKYPQNCYGTFASTDKYKCKEIITTLQNANTKADVIIDLFDNDFEWNTDFTNNINNIPPTLAKQMLIKFGFKEHSFNSQVQSVDSWQSTLPSGTQINDNLKSYLSMLVSIVNGFTEKRKGTSGLISTTHPASVIDNDENTPAFIKARGISWAPQWKAGAVSQPSSQEGWKELLRNQNKTYGAFSRGFDPRNTPFGLGNISPALNWGTLGAQLSQFGQRGGNVNSITSEELNKALSNQETKLACSSGISRIMKNLIAKLKSTGYILSDEENIKLVEMVTKLSDNEEQINKIANEIMKFSQIVIWKGERGSGDTELKEGQMNSKINQYYDAMTSYDKKSTSFHSIIPLLEQLIANATGNNTLVPIR